MTTVVGAPCWACTHKRELGHGCDAYPDGIPIEIVTGVKGWAHDKPLPGDHGIQFELPVPPQ